MSPKEGLIALDILGRLIQPPQGWKVVPGIMVVSPDGRSTHPLVAGRNWQTDAEHLRRMAGHLGGDGIVLLFDLTILQQGSGLTPHQVIELHEQPRRTVVERAIAWDHLVVIIGDSQVYAEETWAKKKKLAPFIRRMSKGRLLVYAG